MPDWNDARSDATPTIQGDKTAPVIPILKIAPEATPALSGNMLLAHAKTVGRIGPKEKPAINQNTIIVVESSSIVPRDIERAPNNEHVTIVFRYPTLSTAPARISRPNPIEAQNTLVEKLARVNGKFLDTIRKLGSQALTPNSDPR